MTDAKEEKKPYDTTMRCHRCQDNNHPIHAEEIRLVEINRCEYSHKQQFVEIILICDYGHLTTFSYYDKGMSVSRTGHVAITWTGEDELPYEWGYLITYRIYRKLKEFLGKEKRKELVMMGDANFALSTLPAVLTGLLLHCNIITKPTPENIQKLLDNYVRDTEYWTMTRISCILDIVNKVYDRVERERKRKEMLMKKMDGV